MELEDRWFVRFRGQTVGPLNEQQVRICLQKRELSADDKISSARQPGWQRIGDLPLWKGSGATASLQLQAPPSPQVLRKKKKVDLPALPAPSLQAQPSVLEAALSPNHNPATISKAARIVPKRKPQKKKAKAKRAASPQATEVTAPLASLAPPQPAPLAAPPMQPVASPAAAGASFSRADAKALLETLKAWDSEEPKLPQERAAPAFVAPERPQMPVYLHQELPPARGIRPSAAKEASRIEFHFTASRPFLWAIGAAAALALAAVITAALLNKTRGPEGLRLPDPSSPLIQPLETGDPNPPLKAPTRPQRD